jgi:hypothetical protein
VLPTVNALLSDYLHRLPAKVTYSADTGEWLANSSRFLCTDAMSGYGPLSGSLPVMALTQADRAALNKGREYLIPFLVEAAP